MGLTLLLALLMAFLFQSAPLGPDDYWYRMGLEGEGTGPAEFRVVLENCLQHWQTDTGRLCNTALAPFLGLWPRWAFSLLSGLMVWLTILAGWKLIGSRPWSLPTFLWIFLYLFVFPWTDWLVTIVFCFNYVWGAAWLVLSLWLWQHCRDRSSLSLPSLAGLFLLGIIVGWWHEAVGVTLGAGLLGYSLLAGRRMSKATLALGLGTLAGLIILFSFPAIKVRLSGVAGEYRPTGLPELIRNSVFIGLWLAYLLIFLIALLNKRLRKRMMEGDRGNLSTAGLYLGMGLAGSILFYRFFMGPRVGAFVQIAGALGLAWILGTVFRFRISRVLKAAILLVGYLLCIVSLGSAVIRQRQLTAEEREVNRLLRVAGGKGEIYVYFDPFPPIVGLDAMRPTYGGLNTLYGCRGRVILPTALKTWSGTTADLEPESADGLWRFGAVLLMEDSGDNPTSWRLVPVPDGRGGTRPASFYQVRFRTPDGRSWIYLKPDIRTRVRFRP